MNHRYPLDTHTKNDDFDEDQLKRRYDEAITRINDDDYGNYDEDYYESSDDIDNNE